ncbi:MAG TPA: phosphopantetheine-binding protein [Micromonosporaceae bacterium]|nr:phosphopantetheine-binding protein [Micromonosporaceae bacterium]
MNSATVEKKVAEIWQEALDAPAGQDDATFFELGGQSVAALLIVAWLEDELGVTTIGVDDLFDDPDLTTFTQQVVSTLEPATV